MRLVSLMFLFFWQCSLSPSVHAATGKAAALKYFQHKKKKSSAAAQVSSRAAVREPGAHQMLTLAVGSLLNGKSYHWIEDDDFGGWTAEASYVDAASGTFANGFHLELQNFVQGDEKLSKISALVSFIFPRRLSFPVYIAVAAGPGYFVKQRKNESEFSIDYKSYIGFRLDDDHSQYFLQSGVKNHIHMLSDGQFIGWFVSSGVAYKF